MKSAIKATGLRYWMERVLEECENVAADFRADPVHDLRVALRRCRSMADGMIAMDPERNWKAMKKGGKQLFQSLGALRDIQIMMEWIEKLKLEETSPAPKEANAPASEIPAAATQAPDPLSNPAKVLFQILRQREAHEKGEARAALESFDRKQWRHWSKILPARTARIRPGSAVFKHLALERWTTARELHSLALRNRSQVVFHTLRIGIKRFRYIVENFLPAEHQAWSNDLKRMQDLLGEVHDLDVLWATAQSCHIFADDASRKEWHERIWEERTKRIDEYRQKTTGADSLWHTWRAGLPQGKQIEQIATRRMKLWAKALDPDFAHSERVARLSLQLYDGLVKAGMLGTSTANNGDGSDVRSSLYVAALLHDVGKSKGKKGHHKESEELIRKHGTPLGWNPEVMGRAALVARFHCGPLPLRSNKGLRDLLPGEQKIVVSLSAILRLANALDCTHDGQVRRITLANVPTRHTTRTNGFLRKPFSLPKNEAMVIAAEGYSERSPIAQTVAAERYLLETVLRRPLIVRPLAQASR